MATTRKLNARGKALRKKIQDKKKKGKKFIEPKYTVNGTMYANGKKKKTTKKA